MGSNIRVKQEEARYISICLIQGMKPHKTMIGKCEDQVHRETVDAAGSLTAGFSHSTRYKRLEKHHMNCSCPGSSSSILWTVRSPENQAKMYMDMLINCHLVQRLDRNKSPDKIHDS